MAPKELTPTRLEAFSDGVIAIIITIMVLEMKVPHGTDAAGFVTAFSMPVIGISLAFIVSLMYFLPNAWLEKD